MKMKRLPALVMALLLLAACACAEQAAPRTQWAEVGEGAHEMTLVLVLPDGITKGYHIRSDKATLLEGLLALELATVMPAETGFALQTVDGCALPADDPDACWFIAVYDAALDTLTPCREPLEQLPLPGQTYAIGLISGLDF